MPTVKKWTSEAKIEVQSCLDWSVFENSASSLNEYTDTVTSYISFCGDVCVATKSFRTFNNNKPWFTAKLKQLRQAQEDAYRSGERALYNRARNQLTKEINIAKRNYAAKLEKQFTADDFKSVRHALQSPTNCKRRSPQAENNSTLANDLAQGCVLSPLLFPFYTDDCISTHPAVKLLKFADDTTVIGLIKDGDESAYRQEAERLELRCGRHNLEPNTLKAVEMIVDFRRHPSPQPPFALSSWLVSIVETFKFLGITVSQDLKCAININSVLKKAQQRMYFLRLLKKHDLPQELLRQFYTAVFESVLSSSITVSFGVATKKDKLCKRLQRTIETAEKITAPTNGDKFLVFFGHTWQNKDDSDLKYSCSIYGVFEEPSNWVA
ncbi:uncharacterized protein zmp:0000000991 isoform X4 [Phyllopteryx taeniolatus]|uniref:uncharacterized protein zmp:0000000991 isoform X4 n=1 Tax=Phyllopteryx taeniolatus TaxID=161469 RepID=UPI002AD2C504|nr:uncharacterized protein zmp:0000000991 isoform X4 [Phyllopteryx taeniolatus]